MCTQGTFANVVVQHGLDGLQADGILGLGPMAHTNEQNFTSTLFLEKLHQEGQIAAPMFSLLIDPDDDFESKLTIGGYEETKFGAPDAELVWHDLKPNSKEQYNHWRLNME